MQAKELLKANQRKSLNQNETKKANKKKRKRKIKLKEEMDGPNKIKNS